MGSESGILTLIYDDGSTASLNLSAEAVVSLNARVVSTSNGINVSWNPYTEPTRFSQYRIYRSTSDITTLSGLNPITTISAIGTTTYTDTTAVIGTKYYYSVVAFDGGSNMLTSVVSVGPVNFLNIGKVGVPLQLTPALNGGRSPHIASNSNAMYQDYLVIYEYDTTGANTNWDIYGQRVTGDGQKIGSPFAILNGTYNERNPRVAYNSTNNEYLVVAEYDANGAGLYQVRAQRVTAGGLLAGGAFTVYGMAVAQYAPDLAYNPLDNTYLVAFQSDYTGDGRDDILNLQLSSTGSILAGTYRNNTSGSYRKPRVVYNAEANEHFAVFEYLNDYNEVYIHGLRISPGGSALTNNLLIDDFAAYNGYYPDVVYNPTDNGYAVVWQSGGSSYSTWARKVAADGALGTYMNYSASGYSFFWPTIHHFADKNEYILALTSQASATGENDVIAQRIYTSNLGLITTRTVGISAESSRIERKAIAVYNPDRTEFMTAFEYVNGTDLDVRTQRIGNVTENLGASPGVLDFGTEYSQLSTQVADMTGQNYLYLDNSTDQPWLSVSPGSIYSSIPTTELTVTVSRNLLGVGSHSGNVLVTSNGFVTMVPVTVTVVNSPPTAPGNPAPQNNASVPFNIGSGLTAALGWDCSDPNYGDSLSYDIYLSQNQTLVNNSDLSVRMAAGITAKTVTTTTLAYGKTYYWRIKAKDGYGSSTTGPVWSFTTVPIPAPAVIAYSPNITKNMSPTLSWNVIPGITKYRLQLAINSTFSPLLAEYPSVTATSQAIVQSLPDGKIHWRVAGVDGIGVQGAFSPASDFTVDTAPPTVQIISPTGLVGMTPILYYTVSEGTVKVKVDGVQVSKVAGYQLDPLESGTHTVQVESLDAAGNLGFAQTTFNVDGTAPTTTMTPDPGTFTSGQNVTLSCNDDSAGSGCAATYYCIGTDCTPTILYGGPIDIPTSTEITFLSRDNAGNSETMQTATFIIADAAPVPALGTVGIIVSAIGLAAFMRRRWL